MDLIFPLDSESGTRGVHKVLERPTWEIDEVDRLCVVEDVAEIETESRVRVDLFPHFSIFVFVQRINCLG